MNRVAEKYQFKNVRLIANCNCRKSTLKIEILWFNRETTKIKLGSNYLQPRKGHKSKTIMTTSLSPYSWEKYSEMTLYTPQPVTAI